MSNVGHNFYRGFLAQALTEGGSETTIYVDRITTFTGETMATADFADLTFGVLTVNPDADGFSSFPENISFTAIDGTTLAFTGAIRGLSSKSITPITANKRFYPIGTPVVISWGVHSWGQLKDYVDDAVAGFTSFFAPGTAGETVVAGNLIYFDDADNEWKKTDADTAATVENTLLGIAQGSGIDGGAIVGGVLIFGYDQNQTSLTPGAIYYASNTAGGISASPGTKEVTIGFSRTASTLYFNPRFNQMLTEDQQDALAGTDGTPSAANLFQTASGFQKQTAIYAVSGTGTDSYAITVTPAVVAYAVGMKFSFVSDVANTGAATLAVSGLSAVPIKKLHDQALSDGDIEFGQIVDVVYDGTNFQMQSQTANTPAASSVQSTFTAGETITAGQPVTALNYSSDVITFDTSANGSGTTNSSFSTTFTVANNSNRVLIIALRCTDGTDKINAITYNGVSMSKQVSNSGGGSSNNEEQIWYLFAPATGAHTVQFTASGTIDTLLYNIYSYYNVLQSGQTSSSGTGTNSSSASLAQLKNGAIYIGAVFDGTGGGTSFTNHIITNGTFSSGDSGNIYPPSIQTVSNSGGGANTACLIVAFSPSETSLSMRVYKSGSLLAINVNSFVGFAVGSSTVGNTISIATAGVASSQSALTIGAQYYIADTLGTLGTSAGTVSRKVGIAVSATEILVTNIW